MKFEDKVLAHEHYKENCTEEEKDLVIEKEHSMFVEGRDTSQYQTHLIEKKEIDVNISVRELYQRVKNFDISKFEFLEEVKNLIVIKMKNGASMDELNGTMNDFKECVKDYKLRQVRCHLSEIEFRAKRRISKQIVDNFDNLRRRVANVRDFYSDEEELVESFYDEWLKIERQNHKLEKIRSKLNKESYKFSPKTLKYLKKYYPIEFLLKEEKRVLNDNKPEGKIKKTINYILLKRSKVQVSEKEKFMLDLNSYVAKQKNELSTKPHFKDVERKIL